jgi:hypothetical protein
VVHLVEHNADDRRDDVADKGKLRVAADQHGCSTFLRRLQLLSASPLTAAQKRTSAEVAEGPTKAEITLQFFI